MFSVVLGPGLGTAQRQLLGGGAATLGGTLRIRTGAGFSPVVGDVYTLGAFASRTGTFATIDAQLPPGFVLTPQYSSTSFAVRIEQGEVGPPGAGTYQESDPRITYVGTWTSAPGSKDSGGAIRLAPNGPASASFTFTGTGIRWLSRRMPSSGINNVFVDNVLITPVDRYAATNQYAQQVFSKLDLPAGVHTIRVEHTGSKNPAASDDSVMLDAFVVS